MKFDGLFVDAGFALAGVAPIARAGAGQAGFGVDIDAQGQVGNQAVTRDPIDFEDRVPTQTSRGSLVGD